MKSTTRGVLCTLLMLPGSATWSGDITLVPGVEYEYRSSEYSEIGGGINGIDTIDAEMTMLNVTFAASWNKFFAKLSNSSPLSEYSEGRTTVDYGAADWYERAFTRKESTFTVGYQALNFLNVYVGYLTGKSSDRFHVETLGPVAGGDWIIVNRSTDISQKGPYLGASLSQAFKNGHAVSANLAYAKLDGEYVSDLYAYAPAFTGLPDPYRFKFVYEGETTGFSYGVTYSIPASPSVTYKVGAKFVRYDFEDDRFGIEQSEDHDIFFVGLEGYF